MNQVSVIAYFADDPTRTYQLVQWLEVLAILHEKHPVAIVLRDSEAAVAVQSQTDLPMFVAATLGELTDLYARLDAKVVLYCNNSMLNVESLLDGRRLHAHISHGESDKQSMASNNAKAYDRVFVAGEAAVQRLTAGLLEFDTSRLVRTGRPQLDRHRRPLLAPSSRRTVLYAPTWEGDAEYNNYTSVDTMGAAIVQAILDVPGVRLVYKPHPKVPASLTRAVSNAHQEIVRLVGSAARRDPAAGHEQILYGDILAVMPACDAIVTDVSSVGLDWLYLYAEKPIFLTDRHRDPERLRREVPMSRCADVIDDSAADVLTALLTDPLEHDDHQLARVAMRRHYFDDLQVGDSTLRFLDAVAELAALRDQLLGHAGRPDAADGAITA